MLLVSTGPSPTYTPPSRNVYSDLSTESGTSVQDLPPPRRPGERDLRTKVLSFYWNSDVSSGPDLPPERETLPPPDYPPGLRPDTPPLPSSKWSRTLGPVPPLRPPTPPTSKPRSKDRVYHLLPLSTHRFDPWITYFLTRHRHPWGLRRVQKIGYRPVPLSEPTRPESPRPGVPGRRA